jgi:hypothetical protein
LADGVAHGVGNELLVAVRHQQAVVARLLGILVENRRFVSVQLHRTQKKEEEREADENQKSNNRGKKKSALTGA